VRLVEWNVAMSLQRKAHLLASLEPTIAILPESAHPDRTGQALAAIGATSTQWIGSNPNKGLLVAAFDGWTLRIDDSYDPGYQWVMPVHLSGPRDIRLLAVWDMNHRGDGHDAAKRLGACRASMTNYEEFLSGASDLTVISGDFNNSVYWDTPTKRARFGDFMDDMEVRGFASAYHSHHGSARGAEPHPTLWWMKNIDRTYHIDYTFVSHPATIKAVAMGAHADWIAHSDHSPMTVDLLVDHIGTPRPKPAAEPSVVNHGSPQFTRQATSRPIRDPGYAAVEDHLPMSRTKGRSEMRFAIEAETLSDMVCGVNGDALAQAFRPTHVTAEWRNGVLAEVRIWGPRVLNDGSLGKRLLDHRWHDVRGSGPVRYGDLPAAVADRLRSYASEHRFTAQP
jgi:hypothetical protein